MAWTNILDMPDVNWTFCVRFNSISGGAITSFLVPIADVDPEIGTVSIEAGEIVCDFGDLSGSGGVEIVIVAIPNGPALEPAPFRVTGRTGSGTPMSSGTEGAWLFSLAGLEEVAPGEFDVIDGAVRDELPVSVPVTAVVASADLPSGEGLGFQRNYTGF